MKTNEIEEKQVELVHVAHLDSTRVFFGVDSKPRSELLPTDVEVPANCDLEAGMYQWDWNDRCFKPLMHLFRARNKAAKAARAEILGRTRNRKTLRIGVT